MYVGRIMSLLRDRAKVPISIGFRAVGTMTGLIEFIGDPARNYEPYVHFGIGESVLTTAEHEMLVNANVEVIQVPLVLSVLGFYHSVPGITPQTGPMNLSACLLAQIYQGKISKWNDPKIVDLNPNWRLYQHEHGNLDYTIKLTYRSGGSSMTFKVQQYFEAATAVRCPGTFPYKPAFTNEYFARGASSYALSSDAAVSRMMQDNPMVLGYLGLGEAKEQHLMPVLIEDASGVWRNPLEADPYDAIKDASEFPSSPLFDYKGTYSGRFSPSPSHRFGSLSLPHCLVSEPPLLHTHTHILTFRPELRLPS